MLVVWLARMVPAALLTNPRVPLPMVPDPSMVLPLLVSTSVPATPCTKLVEALDRTTVPVPLRVVLPLICKKVLLPVEFFLDGTVVSDRSRQRGASVIRELDGCAAGDPA